MPSADRLYFFLASINFIIHCAPCILGMALSILDFAQVIAISKTPLLQLLDLPLQEDNNMSHLNSDGDELQDTPVVAKPVEDSTRRDAEVVP